MLFLLMSDADLIGKLYDEINRQNSFYFWYISGLMAILGIVLGFFGVLQWRLSEKQIQKMKDSTKQELEEKYHFQETINKVDESKKHLEELNKKIEKLSQGIDDNRKKLDTVIRDKEKRIADSIAADAELNLNQKIMGAQIEKSKIESQATLLTMMDDNSADAKTLANAMREKIDKLMKDKRFENISSPLTTTYNILKKSNKKAANDLADYLKNKYPIDTFFIDLNNI